MNLLSLASVALAAASAIMSVCWRRCATQRKDLRRQLESKRAELVALTEASALAEKRHRSLFDSVPTAIVVAKIDGTLIDINEFGVRMFGESDRTRLLAQNTRMLYANPAERERQIASAIAEPGAKPREMMMRRMDGTTFPALYQINVICDAGGTPNHIEAFVTDLSDLKRLEQDRLTLEHEQRISTRLKSVGALAAGIAHEINTPMQFVSDSVYFLKTAISDLDVLWPHLANLVEAQSAPGGSSNAIKGIKEALNQIDADHLIADARVSAERALEGIRRVTTIIRAMREFAHPDNGEHSYVDINGAIETTLTVCRNVYKEVADVDIELGPLPPVLCQYGEINQAFLNIIVNAAHAIEAQHRDGAKGLIRISTALDDNWAVIRISDNGTGIPESVKGRIFDPFFTTKEVGKGTGQGLAIVQSVIVERHRGRVTVDSELGKGTTFILRLPVGEQSWELSGVNSEQEV